MTARRTIVTGFPPPERQIASQVRSAFGFTQGVEGPAGPMIAPVRRARSGQNPIASRSRQRAVRAALESVADFPHTRRVLGWLFDAAEMAGPMPRPSLACREIFGADNGLFDASLARLEARGLVRVWRNDASGSRREIAVRLAATDEVVTTAGAHGEMV